MAFKTQLPYLNRIQTQSKESGKSLGPFADQQMAGPSFLDAYLAKLRDTNPVLPAKKFGAFDQKIDLIEDPASKQIIPNTGRDPFATSGQGYLKNFISAYDRSIVLNPDDRVNPNGLTSLVQENAAAPEKFPGSEGTAIS